MAFFKKITDFFDSSDTKNNKSIDFSLQQGANFKTMQAQIEKMAGCLPIMDNDSNELIENFSSGHSGQPLDNINKRELQKLELLENEFNKAVKLYSDKYKQILVETNIKPQGHGYAWDSIKNNIMWKGPLSPNECKAKCDGDSACTAWQTCNNGEKGSLDDGTVCEGCYLINKKNISAPTKGSPNAYWKSSSAALANRELSGASKAQLKNLFEMAQTKAQLLNKEIQKFHTQRQHLIEKNGVLATQQKMTLKQLKHLNSSQNRYNNLISQNNTLEAALEDSRLQMNSEQFRYFIWLGAAITLGLVALHKTRSPTVY